MYQDIFETFKQFHEAGLPDFGFMRRCREKNSLQAVLLFKIQYEEEEKRIHYSILARTQIAKGGIGRKGKTRD